MSENNETNHNQSEKKTEETQSESKTAENEASAETESPGSEEEKQENAPVEGRAWQVAQLAAQMVPQSGIYGRLENEEWRYGEQFQIARITEAVRAAHLILEVASQPVDETIYASTLFEPGDVLNAPDIAKRFEEVGWPNLGKTKVRERFGEIQQCWKGSISTYRAMETKLGSGNESAIRKITNSLASLAGDTDVLLTINDFQRRASNLLQEIRREIPPSPDSYIVSADRFQALHDWCFPDTAVERTKRQGEMLYRVHELLRFAEEQYEKQIGLARQNHRFHQISNATLNEELEKAQFWLPEPLRRRPLTSLKSPFNRSSFNSPPTIEVSFAAFNLHRVLDPALRYPW